MVKRSRSRKSGSPSRRMSVKQARVGQASANKASFAAKLGAFICENQKLGDVVGDLNGFYQKHNGRSVNPVSYTHLTLPTILLV